MEVMESENILALRNANAILRDKVQSLEFGWSQCSQTCAQMQTERDAARAEVEALQRLLYLRGNAGNAEYEAQCAAALARGSDERHR